MATKTKKKDTGNLRKLPTYDEYVDKVVDQLGLADVPKDVLNDMKEQITHMLDVRIMDRVIGAFSDEDFMMVDYLMMNFEDIDEMDAVLVVATEKPNLNELLESMMAELTKDLEAYSIRVQEFLNEPKTKK
jgi:hypothetical protein